MNGSSTANSAGVFGTLGVFAAGNQPPAFYEACQWTDLNGNFWMYGGCNLSLIDYGDLWEYKPAINQWAWIMGPGTPSQPAVYGTLGVPSPTNYPGSRSWCVTTWTDNTGDLWMFGGCTGSTLNHFNDLWRYHIATNEWTWMSGSNSFNATGIYGTQGIPAPANVPGSRRETNASWTDATNNLWMFGGIDDVTGTLSDMWKYNIASNEWTWMSGPSTANGLGNWGTIGVPSATNIPCGRRVYTKWKDPNGDMWLFGGNDNSNSYNDVWRYNPGTNNWTWMSGTSNPADGGSSGLMCMQGVNYIPASRYESRACWVRGCQTKPDFLMYGGGDPLVGPSTFGDLWNYDVVTNSWAWIQGTLSTNVSPNYGAITVSAATNSPGGRMGALSWEDQAGNLWIFGGALQWASGVIANDIWRFVVDTTCPILLTPANAAFTVSADTGCVPFNVSFTNNSSNATSYLWNFGDGNTSAATNPSHVYNTPGIDTVVLIAFANGACVTNDTITSIIVVFAPAAVNLGPDTSLCSGLSKTLNAGNPGATYLWSTGETTQIIHVTTTGNYWVHVAAPPCGVAADTILITFIPAPAVALGNDTSLCVGLPITLDAGNPGLTFHWSTNANTETITPTLTGNYSVSVTNTNGCTGIDTIDITFIAYPLVNLGNDTSICIGNSLTINAANAGMNYLWSTGETTQTIAVNAAGNYSVTVTTTIGNCSDVDTLTVGINPLPIVNLGNDTTACYGQPITINAGNIGATYLWNTNTNSQTISPNNTGNYAVTVTDIHGCKNADTVLVTFVPYPNLSLGNDRTLCSNEVILLFGGSPATSYLWQDGSTNSTFLITTGGTYWVRASNQFCPVSDTITITTVIAPTVNIGPDIKICFGQDTALTANNPGLSILWSTGETTPTIRVISSGDYWVKVTRSGCSGYDTANVNIDKQLILNLGLDTFLCPGDQMMITPGNEFINYSWLPDGQIGSKIIIDQPGTYVVTVTDSNGCKASGSRLVQEFCPSELYVPNAFTPNGNHMNDLFMAYGERIIYFHMYVFDRWGELLYEANDITLGWDGTYMGNICQQGTYIYRIDYKLYDMTELKAHTIYGNVNLIR